MEDGLEMIDRKNSVSSVKKAVALGVTTNSFGGGLESVFIGLSKPKTSSTSSSDSASTSDSFNDIGVAPPGYNIFDETTTTGSSFLDQHNVSGPHRELPVDVPDSFVGTIKQTPRYPQFNQHTPSISTFKPQPRKEDPEPSQLPTERTMANNPFSLHEGRVFGDSDNCINTNSISSGMQPQPQTPSIDKEKVFFVNYIIYLLFL